MHQAKVLQVIPLVDGIFSYMDYTFWDFTDAELDILLLSKMGQRPVSPLIDIIQGPPEDICVPRPKLNSEQLAQLASIILKTFKPKWDRLSSLHSLDYDILRNYLDEYNEVLKDSKDVSSQREQAFAKDSASSGVVSTTTGIEGQHDSVSSNNSTTDRSDSFGSTFSRASTEGQTRTDNLSEVLDKAKSSTTLRTDALEDREVSSGSDTKTIAGGDYQFTKSRVTQAAGEGASKSDVYGFNSLPDTPVGDSESVTTSTNAGSETSVESATGSKTETLAKGTTIATGHTGTQELLGNEVGADVKVNTGTQQTSGTISISDQTVTSDSQSNASLSHGAASSTDASTSTSDTSSEDSTSEVSRLTDSNEESAMLNRAKISIHKGNIGNFTPQQLIEQEINLWRWNFINEVFDDIKSLITIPIYI